MGQDVFIIYNNKVYKVEVIGVMVEITRAHHIVKYRVMFPAGGETQVDEGRMFETKEDLLETL